MSFSGKVKDELSRVNVGKLHCVDAELLAIMTMCGSIHISQNDRYSIKVQTENIDVARRISILLSKRFKSNIIYNTFTIIIIIQEFSSASTFVIIDH